MHVAHVHGFVYGGAAATVVAGVLADASRRGRQWVVQDDRKERVLYPPFFVELEEARDVHVQRAGILAGRKGQVLAYAGAAALGHDVVFELVPEVAQARQNRIWGARAEGTQRSVADHAAQLVESLEILVRGRAKRAVIQNSQRLVQAHAARDAFAATL